MGFFTLLVMSLKEYKKKRSFKKIPQPKRKITKGKDLPIPVVTAQSKKFRLL